MCGYSSFPRERESRGAGAAPAAPDPRFREGDGYHVDPERQSSPTCPFIATAVHGKLARQRGGELRLGDRRFVIELIKPSHYDDDGYVIQWWKSWIPSNSLACLYGIATDLAQRRALGPDVAIEIQAYDECHTVIPVARIIRRIRSADTGLVCLVGVQSNQFPRAMDLAARFRAAGIQVAVGGFHVSGCLAMLPELPPDLEAARRLGVTLFAGEAEGRLASLFAAALESRLEPIYNFMAD